MRRILSATRLSCHRFRANEVRLQLSVPAYNLGNLWRRPGLPRRIRAGRLKNLGAEVALLAAAAHAGILAVLGGNVLAYGKVLLPNGSRNLSNPAKR